MFLVVTEDLMLFNAVSHLVSPDKALHVRKTDDICLTQHQSARVIIDTLNNNIFHTDMTESIHRLNPECIHILSPFLIKQCFQNQAVMFLPRDISCSGFRAAVTGAHSSDYIPAIALTYRQHRIISLLLQMRCDRSVADELNIAQKTLFTHKYHIMYLLKLRKFSQLSLHDFAVYFRKTE
ncbi:hypothetical protein KDR40_004781 [Salmonella enterica subsp. enterica serovar Saintpaul]|nr:hypothetical protein [Salmonella enterica subsp. enterica serovar Saintpaul]